MARGDEDPVAAARHVARVGAGRAAAGHDGLAAAGRDGLAAAGRDGLAAP